MVEIIGKRNRKASVLLTPDVKNTIEPLISMREQRKVYPVIPVAINDGKSKNCSMVELKSPDVITSISLRKYVATVSQLVDMDENEMGWLAKHLGHDLHIHKEFYRMQESTLEMAVVDSLLVAIDEGRAHKFKGKNLRDISLQGTVRR